MIYNASSQISSVKDCEKILSELYSNGRILFYARKFRFGNGVYRIIIWSGRKLLVTIEEGKLKVFDGRVL